MSHRHRYASRILASPAGRPLEEALVADARAGLTPSDMVERKLQDVLRGGSVAGSHVCMGATGGTDSRRKDHRSGE